MEWRIRRPRPVSQCRNGVRDVARGGKMGGIGDVERSGCRRHQEAAIGLPLHDNILRRMDQIRYARARVRNPGKLEKWASFFLPEARRFGEIGAVPQGIETFCQGNDRLLMSE